MFRWLANNWKSIAAVAVATVVFVGVTVATGGLGAPALVALAAGGFASGVAGYATQQLLDGNPVSARDALIAGGVGAVVTVATVGIARAAAPLVGRTLAPVAARLPAPVARAAQGAASSVPVVARTAAIGAAAGGPVGAGVRVAENAIQGRPLGEGVGDAFVLGTVQGAVAGPLAHAITPQGATPRARPRTSDPGIPGENAPPPVNEPVAGTQPGAPPQTNGTKTTGTPASPEGTIRVQTAGLKGALTGEEAGPAMLLRLGSQRGAVSSDTASTLLQLDPKRNVVIAVDEGFGASTRTVTAEEAINLAGNAKVERLTVREVPPSGEPNVAPVRGKFVSDSGEAGWIDAWPNDGTLIDARVQLGSGEVVAVRGNKDTLVAIAGRSDVTSITTGEHAPAMRWLHQVPEAERAPGHDPVASMRSQIGPGVRHRLADTDLGTVRIYHGTLQGFEESVRAGPRNVGKGFGGRGLYLAVDEPELARHFADMAASESRARVSIYPEGFRASPEANKPVVMGGRVDPEANLRVGQFRIVRNGRVDLENGVLPSDWADNPNLVRLLESEFDVLDLRGMRSAGLVIDTDRFIVVHESAGGRALRWD